MVRSPMRGASRAGQAALGKARQLLAEVRARSMSESRTIELSAALAAELLVLSRAFETRAERRDRAFLARLMDDPAGQRFSTLLTDRVPRLSQPVDVVRQTLRVLEQTGVPASSSPWDRARLHSLQRLGRALERSARVVEAAGTAVRRKIADEAASFVVLDEGDEVSALASRCRAEGLDLNVNKLGEAVLGEREAERHIAAYQRLLALPEVRHISIKISSICAQLSLAAWDTSLARIEDALCGLYRAALDARVSTGAPKIITLDMEAYDDLRLTYEAFVRTLSRPEFRELSAGIVLQAYVPDAHALQESLNRWAMRRVAEGGAPIFLRLVKGANLAAERVHSSHAGWALPTFSSKEEVDASFKAMVDRAVRADVLPAVRVGIGSHNLFEIAYALVRAAQLPATHVPVVSRPRAAVRGGQGVRFEVLFGMATPLSRALRALGQDVLVYCPVVEPASLHSAVAYLVRRLDENTADENFLRHIFGMKGPSGAWAGQVARFRTSAARRNGLDVRPRRAARRAARIAPSKEAAQFCNAPNTDFGSAERRAALAQHLERQRRQPILSLSSMIGERAMSSRAQASADVSGFDPSRPEHVPYRYALATPAEIQQALATGTDAQQAWSKKPFAERVDIVRAVASVLRRTRDSLIAAMVMDGGKSVIEADAEVSEAIDFAEYYAHTWSSWASHAQQAPSARLAPRGLTVVTPPWNFPLAIPLGGVFAALVAGNAVILKPALETAYVAWRAAQACYEAGVPQSALQLILSGDETATALITDERVHTVVLTGGTSTAQLFRALRPNLHLLGETGGKNATIVSRFADLDIAVESVVDSAFLHAGQKCSATSLLIVTPELARDDRFFGALVDAAHTMRVGSAWSPASRVTPLIHPPRGALLRGLTELDRSERWLLEPRPSSENPRLWSPGIKIGVAPGSFSHQTEFFGPVLSVMVARDLDEAVDWANATPYGLTAGFHSLDESEQRTFRERMNAGNLYINRPTTGAIVQRQPFGGRKASSFGPGAKAGGPNYVLQFCRIEDGAAAHDIKPHQACPGTPESAEVEPAEIESVELSRSAAEALNELTARFPDCAVDLRRCAAAYAREAQTYFGQTYDPTALLGQDNLFRYQFDAPVLVAAFERATSLDLGRVALALVTLDVPWELCFAGSAPQPLETRMRDIFGADIVRYEPWPKRIEQRSFHRIRALGDAPSDMAQSVVPDVTFIDMSPVIAHPRIELLKYGREQTISIDTHRYGHVDVTDLRK